jgi:hypothetical protein
MRSPRVPPPGAVGALIAAIGLGVACWYGWAWYQVPRWSEQEIEGSVELNLALDLSRLPAGSVAPAEQARMRAQIRREVEAQIAKAADEPRQYTMAGLLITVFGLVQMALRMGLARR